MNLVAKEYVAARIDNDGVLVLSEFAGSAHELPEALIVNPYCIDEMADAFARALTMNQAERRQRMTGLRRTVLARDVRWWASSFLRDLTTDQSAAAEERGAILTFPGQCVVAASPAHTASRRVLRAAGGR
jgi:trehalose 6-phosphate synthase/phosphatase